MKKNDQALQKAKDMIRKNRYVKDSDWSKSQPDADRENKYIDQHGWDEYGEWHLGIDTSAREETKERFSFPFGDFQRVHRSGLIAAKQRAAQNNYPDIEKAADELLDLLDEEKKAA